MNLLQFHKISPPEKEISEKSVQIEQFFQLNLRILERFIIICFIWSEVLMKL